MISVTNTVVKPNGEPREGASVVIVLSWDTDSADVPSSGSSDVTILGELRTSTDNDGVWTAELFPNSSIEPADSVYKVTELEGDDSHTFYITVPGVGTDLWVGDLLADKPVWED